MSMMLAAALLAAADAPAPVPGARVIVETDKTMADQPLAVPMGPLRVVATRVVLPAGAEVATHLHIWARYVYVESGEVELTPIGKWHSGRIVSDTVLVAVEQVPPGRCNTIKRPEAGKANDC